MNITDESSNPPINLLDTRDAAARLNLSVPTLERMRLSGTGPTFCKLGAGKKSAVRYRAQDLDTWIEAHRRTSTSDRG